MALSPSPPHIKPKEVAKEQTSWSKRVRSIVLGVVVCPHTSQGWVEAGWCTDCLSPRASVGDSLKPLRRPYMLFGMEDCTILNIKINVFQSFLFQDIPNNLKLPQHGVDVKPKRFGVDGKYIIHDFFPLMQWLNLIDTFFKVSSFIWMSSQLRYRMMSSKETHRDTFHKIYWSSGHFFYDWDNKRDQYFYSTMSLDVSSFIFLKFLNPRLKGVNKDY